MLKDFDIKPVWTSVNNPQANSTADRLHQVILNMIVTKDLDNKVFGYMDSWGETLAYIASNIRDSYHHTIMDPPVQAVFGRDILFNLAWVVDWRVATAANQHQVDIDNVRENVKQFTHDYATGNQIQVEMTGIYLKLDYKEKEPYIITEVF